MKITYISHGAKETGGYFHEKALCESLADAVNNCDICFKEIRFRRNFSGPIGWIQLFFKSFFNAKGDVIITVARLAWPVYLRNIFNKTRIVLVIHNFHPEDGKPALYFKLLQRFLILSSGKKDKIAVVTIAEYWNNYLSEKLNFRGTGLVFPNLFDNNKLFFYRDIVHKKSNLIHLGQWSEKIDKKAYRVFIHAMQHAGLVCYFSDNSGAMIQDFPVTYFTTHEAYLKQMALSKCTVIFNRIDEGWNRVAHESMLTGTTVITTGGGGLTELVQAGNSTLVKDVDEAIQESLKEEMQSIDYTALQKFDISNSSFYIDPLKKWLNK